MQWQPHPEHVKQLVSLLERSQKPDGDQRAILEQLDSQRSSADFNNHLAYLFAYAEDASELVRVDLEVCRQGSPSGRRPCSGKPRERRKSALADAMRLASSGHAMQIMMRFNVRCVLALVTRGHAAV